MTTFAALGDSITVGVGDPVPGRAWRGWAALLAGGLPEPRLHNLARSGAQSADVEHDQLPRALELRPDVASVIVGINDTLRASFDPVRIARAAEHTVGALCSAGAVVLTIRLPDPGLMLGLPGALARPLARRIRTVNAVMDDLADRFGTLHFDAAGDPDTYDPRMWSVDRLHPSERGHRLIACRFHDRLAAAGLLVGPRPEPEPSSPPPTRFAQAAWMATMGTAWVIKRSTDLVPYLVFMGVRELWTAGAGTDGDHLPARPGTPASPARPGTPGRPGGAAGLGGAGEPGALNGPGDLGDLGIPTSLTIRPSAPSQHASERALPARPPSAPPNTPLDGKWQVSEHHSGMPAKLAGKVVGHIGRKYEIGRTSGCTSSLPGSSSGSSSG